MSRQMALHRVVLAGALWGLWTIGLPVVAMLAFDAGWLFDLSGLSSASTHGGADLTARLAERAGLPWPWALMLLLAGAVPPGLAVVLLPAMLDPHGIALASVHWAAKSWRAWAVAVGVGFAIIVPLSFLPDDGWGFVGGALLMLSLIVMPNLLGWLVFRPSVVAGDRVGPLLPARVPTRRVVKPWSGLVAGGWLVDCVPTVGALLSQCVRALEVHWLLNRERPVAMRRLGGGVLRWKLIAPWLALPLWLLLCVSLFIGPALASCLFDIFQMPQLRDAAETAGVELPAFLIGWSVVCGYAVRYGWIIATFGAGALIAGSVFAEGRLGYLQRHSLDALAPQATASNGAVSPAANLQNPHRNIP